MKSLGPRLYRGLSLPVLLVVGFLAVLALAPAAQGASTSLLSRFCDVGAGAGQCKNPRGAAVDPATGNVYIGSQGNLRVDEFTAWGEFVKAWGWGVVNGAPELQTCTTSCLQGLAGGGTGQFGQTPASVPRGGQGIAVDSSGKVYVVDQANHRVQKFNTSGSSVQFELMFGGGVNKTKVDNVGSTEAERNRCTAASGNVCQAGTEGTGNGQFGAWQIGSYIAIGPAPAGTIYVGDVGRIEEFDTTGTYKGQIKTAPLAGKTIQSLAVDRVSGNLYATFFQNDNTSEENVRRLSPAGVEVGTPLKVKNPSALATDAAGNVYVFDRSAISIFPQTDPVLEFNPAGELIGSLGKEEFNVSTGMATSSACGIQGTDLFVSNSSPSNAYIGLYGPPPDTDLCPPPSVPPTIKAQHALSVGTASATVRAQINPHFWPDASYYVEYGTADCKGAPEACKTRALFPGAQLNAGVVNGLKTTAGVFLSGLSPDTTYFYRFVAKSTGGGPTFGDGPTEEGGSFHTFPLPAPPRPDPCPNASFRGGTSAKLPDCRAYEMVSPLDKDNGDISTGERGHEQSSPDGERATYSSFRAFGNPQSAPLGSQYISVRDSNAGWLTQAINPPRTALSFYPAGSNGLQFKAFSEDLCSGWLVQDVEVPLTPGVPPGVPNLYRRDLCGGGGYELITTVPPPGFSVELEFASFYYPDIQGFSVDGSRSVFHADAKLTPDAFGERGIFQVYEQHAGQLHLVSVLPNGEAASIHSAVGTDNGTALEFRIDSLHHAVSDDASRIFWSASEDRPATEGGGDSPLPGKLYVRLNPEQEQSASGGCGGADAGKACTIEISASDDSQFWGADPEGKTAIYTNEGLAGGEADLYEFDVDTETQQLIAGGVKGLLGMSEDARRIYLVSSEDLATGATAGAANLYLYEKGSGFSFVATLTASETDANGKAGGASVDNFVPSLRTSRVSPSGLHATFMSASTALSELSAGYDNTDANSGQPDAEVYLYDAGEEKLVCISCNMSGVRPSGREVVGGLNGKVGAWAAAQIPGWESQLHPSRVLSVDGSRLFFESFEALVLRDTNAKQDVYEWERADSVKACEEAGADLFVKSTGGCISLISSGNGAEDSQFVDASASGSDVFFTTESSLLSQDFGLVDVYDARVNGGFAPPTPPRQACEGEACQSPSAPPDDPTPASSALGKGNVKGGAKPRCPKGKRKVRQGGKPRCVAKHKKHKASRHHGGSAR